MIDQLMPQQLNFIKIIVSTTNISNQTESEDENPTSSSTIPN